MEARVTCERMDQDKGGQEKREEIGEFRWRKIQARENKLRYEDRKLSKRDKRQARYRLRETEEQSAMRQNNYWSDRYKRQFKNQTMRRAVKDQHAGGQGYCRLEGLESQNET